MDEDDDEDESVNTDVDQQDDESNVKYYLIYLFNNNFYRNHHRKLRSTPMRATFPTQNRKNWTKNNHQLQHRHINKRREEWKNRMVAGRTLPKHLPNRRLLQMILDMIFRGYWQ